MSTKKQNILWLSLVLTGVLCITNLTLTLGTEKGPSIGYVDYTIVFNGFDLKKELETRLAKETTWQKKMVDSLGFDLQVLKSNIEAKQNPSQSDIDVYRKKQSFYFQKKKDYESLFTELTRKYDDQILVQMNQYIQDFGTESGFDYIFGADNSGHLLYGDKSADITERVSDFVNNKYQGKL